MTTTELGPRSAAPRRPRRRTYSDRNPAWMEQPSLAGRLAKGVALAAVVVLVVFPFLVVVSTSVSSQAELTRNGGFVLLPSRPTLEAYRSILSGGVVTRALLVSIGITTVGTALSLVLTVLLAYGLSRRGSLGHRPLLMVVLLTFLFTPGIIPSYLMVKQLGLLDQYASLVLPVAVTAFNVIIVRGFFMGLPSELLDSARIDGASEWQTLTRIVLPLSKAVVAVIGLFTAVAYWNAFFNALLYLNDASKWPLQLVLRSYVLQGSPLAGADSVDAGVPPPQQAIQMAVVVIAIVPIVCVYPFLQRHFAKGVLTGAVKG